MKNYFIVFISTILLFSCRTENKSPNQNTSDQMQTTTTPISPSITTQAPPSVNVGASTDGIVHHYVCSAGCKGGHSENPGNCPVCGKALAHNQEWHNQPQNQTPQAPTQAVPSPTMPIQPQGSPETVNIPAGPDGKVHHYICKSGCVGGHSENAGNCPVCGKLLAHNQAFHNQ